MSEETVRRRPSTVSSRGANRDNPDTPASFTEKNDGAPTTDRSRRRAKQAANAAQSVKEAAKQGPTKAEKKAAAELKAAQPKPATVDRASVRKTAQAANAERAKTESVTLAATSSLPDVVLKPGEQPTLLQLRRMNRATTKAVRNDATEAAKAAGRAVRDVLVGRGKSRTLQRHERVAASQAAAATAANAAKE